MSKERRENRISTFLQLVLLPVGALLIAGGSVLPLAAQNTTASEPTQLQDRDRLRDQIRDLEQQRDRDRDQVQTMQQRYGKKSSQASQARQQLNRTRQQLREANRQMNRLQNQERQRQRVGQPDAALGTTGSTGTGRGTGRGGSGSGGSGPRS